MRPVPRQARTLFTLAILGFATLAGGSALLSAEPEKADQSSAKQYTATAYLLVDRHELHILPRAAEKDEPAEFESYRATQMQLMKSTYVLIAALRDPKVQKQPSIKREEARHQAVAWLGKEIRVKCPDERTGVLTVSLTSSNPQEAAALVNAVVGAYMNEVVDVGRQTRRERLSELQQICAEKESEVRTKREQLRRELESLGAGDDQTMAARTQLATNIYAEFQREFQRMRSENRVLVGKLKEVKVELKTLPDSEIPEVEVVTLLNNNPMYRDLQSRLAVLESSEFNIDTATPATKLPPGLARPQAELSRVKARLQKLESDTRDQVRGVHRIALERDLRRLETQVEISGEQLRAFEKEVEKKRDEAESVSRTSIAVQMSRADVESVERILRNVADECATLRVELRARNRVRVLGDQSAPAAVPECPD
jgi:polysaccharide biosynthesis transport protein